MTESAENGHCELSVCLSVCLTVDRATEVKVLLQWYTPSWVH